MLQNLPDDVLRRIFSQMLGKELGRASCVSKHWQKVLKEDGVWKMVFQRVYKVPSLRDRESAWRDVYIQKCKWKYGKVVENLVEGFDMENIHLYGRFLASGGPIDASLRNAAGLLNVETGKFECDRCDEGFNFNLGRHHGCWILAPAAVHLHSSKILLWNLKTGEKSVMSLDGQGTIACLDFAGSPPDTVVTGSSRIRIWNVKTEECTTTINTEGKKIKHLVYLQSDGKVVAAIKKTHEMTVSVFDSESGICSVTIPVLSKIDYIDCLGERIVAFSKGFSRGKIQVWDRESGECINTLCTDTVGNCRFALNKRMLARAALNYITVWDLDSGQCFRRFDLRRTILRLLPCDKVPPIGTFSGLDFDGNRIACSFTNGMVLILTMAEVATEEGGTRIPVKIRHQNTQRRILKYALSRLGRWSILVSVALLMYAI